MSMLDDWAKWYLPEMREHDRKFAQEINDAIFGCPADRHPSKLIVESNPGMPVDPRPSPQEGESR